MKLINKINNKFNPINLNQIHIHQKVHLNGLKKVASLKNKVLMKMK